MDRAEQKKQSDLGIEIGHINALWSDISMACIRRS